MMSARVGDTLNRQGVPMNKYLMMSVASLFATAAAGTAQAGTFSVHYGSSAGGSYCNGLRGTSGPISIADLIYTTCSSGIANITSLALGPKAKNPDAGKKKKHTPIGFLDYSQAQTEVLLDVFESPIKAGGPWQLWTCDSSSCFIVNEGILLSGQYAKGPGKNAPSTTDKVAQTLKNRTSK
jgi:hypothetical protein